MANDRPVLFATYAAHPAITDDDALLAGALAAHGLPVRGVPWDAGERWGAARAVVIRSTWAYHHRLDEFLAWTERVGAATALHNDAPTVRWNAHKRYLAVLAARGIPVIDTVFVARGEARDVADIAAQHGWDDLVVKPAVSASAHQTRAFSSSDRAGAQAHLARLTSGGDAMLQPYLHALGARGELSLLHAAGTFTHAVRRRSALVEEGRMAKSAADTAPAAARDLAARVLAAARAETGAGEAPLYARVDLAEDASTGGYRVLELELVEPSLFLAHAPAAAARYAAALIARL